MSDVFVITFGTFDLFHIGHLRILEKASSLGNTLIVGISTDKFSYEKKNRYPIYDQNHRKTIIESIRYVDKCFFEESLDKKEEYIKKYKADILVMGNDWKGKFDHLNSVCEVVYLPRTPAISTTETIEKIITGN